MASRMSMYSVSSEMLAGGNPRTTGPGAAQLSTTTLLNAVHNIYLQSQPYRLDSGTSAVVNTWLTAAGDPASGAGGPTVDTALVARVWEHARRRAEDGCIILASTHNSAPSILSPLLNSIPTSLPSSLHTALNVLRPFIRCVTPHNPSAPMQSALGVTLTLNLTGNITGAKLALSQGGIDTTRGLLAVPREPGHRAFDVFYYLLTSASTPAEREFLGLKAASAYTLLSRSGTYDPPSYLPTADDSAAADDFRVALKEMGIKGSAHRSLISTLAGLLKLGNTLDYGLEADALEETIEDVSGLLGIEPETLLQRSSTEDRATFVGGLYEALVDWVILKVNASIEAQMTRIRDGAESTGGSSHAPASEVGDTVCITVLEVPDPVLGKALTMRGIFDDSMGINAEMIQDGLDVSSPASSLVREMQTAVAEAATELGFSNSMRERERSHELERREVVLEKIGLAADQEGFIRKLLFPVKGEGISLGQTGRIDLSVLLSSSRAWYHLSVHPTDDSPANLAALPSVTSAWSAGAVSRQLRNFRLPEWANRRNKQLEFTADFDFDEFIRRYAPLGCQDGRDGIEAWVMERGWSSGAVVVGNERVWMRENAWWEAESTLDVSPMGLAGRNMMGLGGAAPDTGYSATGSGFFSPPMLGANQTPNSSSDHLVAHGRSFSQGNGSTLTLGGVGGGGGQGLQNNGSSTALMNMQNASSGDYGLGRKGDRHNDQLYYDADGNFIDVIDAEKAAGKKIVTKKIDKSRQVWVWFVWALTFWIPSPLLRWVGGMKRPDVRMAWREKLVLVFLIFLLNGIILFWIIAFGRLLCPNSDKAWSVKEVNTHQGETDFWVSIRGNVYDISKFWRVDHSDSPAMLADQAAMQPLAGLNLDEYFVPPLVESCPGLGITDRTQLMVNRSATPEFPQAVHTSGFYARDRTSALAATDWYYARFTPAVKEFYKGDLVWKVSEVEADGRDNQHMWVRYNNGIYDLTNLFYTQDAQRNIDTYDFINPKLQTVIAQNPGLDVTSLIDDTIAKANSTERVNMQNSMNCIKNHFYVGIPDFRDEPQCQVNNYILLAFTILLCAVILIKFLAALQFGSKRRPASQDKFVICQVPAYTEGEDSLRKALDSLTALQYDNKRKLICVICDGVIVGHGNDRPTPKIVLDILGVDPKVDPPALPFKSVGTGNEQLNYGKVYSGLYEYEGNVVPYMVIVKVGKESEQAKSKPGNRGKRDSQILLMSFLNRVHHRGPMSPLELEMFHQINNVIGVDPELYEYLLMVDADTCVEEDSLNRLVAACANDAKISGICGETSLQNDEKSWWTMIQVYEYFISHHLAKAFESLFGSVTCLPGCFTMYRLRTVDKGKPLIISEAVIRDYSVCDVDTLHKKNLLALGEDRYLTTLMTKHFPYMSNKFVAAAQCKTAAPESWSVLLSQRRRWINSTIHNLVELMRLDEMCGFCCFSMRFVVFVDLFGTIILPATCVYLGYLIYGIASRTGQFPLLSLIMIAAVYGLQALVFILKRQWQHIGWMIIYICAFPIYAFVLPIYSFWNQDNFSWGNTRIVIGEKGDKQVLAIEDDGGFDPRSIPLQRWDDYALANGLPGRRGNGMYDRSPDFPPENLDAFEKDENRSVYSAGSQGSYRRSTAYMPPPPQSPAFGHSLSRQSTLGGGAPFGAESSPMMAAHRQSMASMGRAAASPSPFQDLSGSRQPSIGNLRGMHNTSPGLSATGAPSGSGGLGVVGGLGNRSSTALSSYGMPRPNSAFDFQRSTAGPDDGLIVEAIQSVLRDVDLDSVTKKQVRALVEQRLQTELVGERKTFMDRQIDRELENM